jgi:hypothetical protein
MRRFALPLKKQVEAIVALTGLATAGCGSSPEGSISLGRSPATLSDKTVLGTVAGMPGAVDPAAVSRMLERSRIMRIRSGVPVAGYRSRGGAR